MIALSYTEIFPKNLKFHLCHIAFGQFVPHCIWALCATLHLGNLCHIGFGQYVPHWIWELCAVLDLGTLCRFGFGNIVPHCIRVICATLHLGTSCYIEIGPNIEVSLGFMKCLQVLPYTLSKRVMLCFVQNVAKFSNKMCHTTCHG